MRPAHNVVAYLALDITVPRTTDALLGLAVDGAYRVWLDGEPVAEQVHHLGGYAVRDEVPIRLTRGDRQLLVKIAVADTAFGAHVRLLDEGGRPLDVAARPARRAGVVARTADVWPSPSTPAERLGVTTEAPFAAAVIVGALQGDDPGEPWRALIAEANPDTADERRWALRVPQPEWQRSALYAQARDAGDETPLDRVARLAWQDRQMALGVRLAAAEELRHWLENGEAPASLTSTTTSRRPLGFDALAAEGRRALDAAAASPAALTWSLVQSASALREDERNLDLYRRALAESSTLYGVTARLVSQLRARGEDEEAERWIARLREASPHSAGVARLVAQDACNRGRLGEALAVLDDALALSPDHVELLEARARLHLEAGRPAQAATDLERWLVVAPQAGDARDLLQRVQRDDDDPFEPWRLDLDTLTAWAEPLRVEPDDAYEVVARQRVVRVHENGLATAWHQVAWLPHTGAEPTRSGASPSTTPPTPRS